MGSTLKTIKNTFTGLDGSDLASEKYGDFITAAEKELVNLYFWTGDEENFNKQTQALLLKTMFHYGTAGINREMVGNVALRVPVIVHPSIYDKVTGLPVEGYMWYAIKYFREGSKMKRRTDLKVTNKDTAFLMWDVWGTSPLQEIYATAVQYAQTHAIYMFNLRDTLKQYSAKGGNLAAENMKVKVGDYDHRVIDTNANTRSYGKKSELNVNDFVEGDKLNEISENSKENFLSDLKDAVDYYRTEFGEMFGKRGNYSGDDVNRHITSEYENDADVTTIHETGFINMLISFTNHYNKLFGTNIKLHQVLEKNESQDMTLINSMKGETEYE